MAYLKLNNQDVSHLVKGLKIGYETLVADNSGRNARGDTVLDVINHKIKVYATFRPMDDTDMSMLLNTIADYVIPVEFRDSKTNHFLPFFDMRLKNFHCTLHCRCGCLRCGLIGIGP